jgi:hypothetical protein
MGGRWRHEGIQLGKAILSANELPFLDALSVAEQAVVHLTYFSSKLILSAFGGTIHRSPWRPTPWLAPLSRHAPPLIHP